MNGQTRGKFAQHAEDWCRWGPILVTSLAALLGALYLLSMKRSSCALTEESLMEPAAETPEKMNQRLTELLCANETNPATEEKLANMRKRIALSFDDRQTTRFLEEIGVYGSRTYSIPELIPYGSYPCCPTDSPFKNHPKSHRQSVNHDAQARLNEPRNR